MWPPLGCMGVGGMLLEHRLIRRSPDYIYVKLSGTEVLTTYKEQWEGLGEIREHLELRVRRGLLDCCVPFCIALNGDEWKSRTHKVDLGMVGLKNDSDGEFMRYFKNKLNVPNFITKYVHLEY